MLNSNGLTMNNFIAVLIEFSFSILFLILFSFIHYTLCNRTKLATKLNQSKAINFWYFFLVGALMSLITFVVSRACSLAINETLGIAATLLGLMVAMTFFYNKSVMVGALIPTIISVIWEADGFNSFSWEWAARVICVVAIAAVSIASTFFKTKKWPTYLISLVVIVGICLGLMFGFKDSELAWDAILLALGIASAILFYWVINKINSVFNRMDYMAKSNLYTDEGYVIPSLLQEQFEHLIKSNNIDQALVVTFVVANNNPHTLSELVKTFKSDTSLLFKTDYDTYGVILTDNIYRISDLNNSFNGNNNPQRSYDDPLLHLQKKLEKFNVTAFVSIYSIHSNDINQLIKFNQYAISQFDKTDLTNQIQLFNSSMLNNQIKDDVSYAQLQQKLDLDEIEVTLETIKFNKGSSQYIYPRFYWTKEFTCDLNDIIHKFDSTTANALLRALAIKSIEAYVVNADKSKPLLINYPISELTNQFFATNQFIKKLKLYGLNKKDIVLSFDCKKIRIWSKVLVNNFKELEQYGIKYMLIDLNNTYPLTLLKPLYVIFDDSIVKNNTKLTKALDIAKQYKLNLLLSK